MKPEDLKTPLRDCGFRRDLLRSGFTFGDSISVPLVAFSQFPTDSRSACVAVIGHTTDPRRAVESCRPLGAPIVFVCFENTLQWWKQGTRSADWLESIPAEKIPSFFKAHQDEFSPEAIYRAKTLGRVRKEHQLTFVDIGVMPLVEEELGTALSNLIARNVQALKGRLAWDDVTAEQGQWLLHTVFWLVSGKILRDKQVPSFGDLNLEDVDDVFHRVATHYGTKPFSAGSKQKRNALLESARQINRFSSLALTATESLAHVYENTLISKRTRSQLGTHSTPAYLVDYVLGHLADWIEEIPENERSVFEPACGHAAFLTAAMRLLTHLLPPEKSIPSRRGPYLRGRLHGTDIDPFALELARLSLTLTDIPNPDGWDLRVEDMFVSDRLESQAKGKTILLANPPFANFSEAELKNYAEKKGEVRINNKAAEMLRRALTGIPEGGVFGVVLPTGILHGSYAKELRRLIIDEFELREISLFPDKVFSFSDAESAVLIGRRIRERSKKKSQVRYRRIREREMAEFQNSYAAPNTRNLPQSRFNESIQWDLRVPDLEEVWLALSDNPTLEDYATLRQGLIYHGPKNLPIGVQTYADERFSGAKRGFIRFNRDLKIHELPKTSWMNVNREAIRMNFIGAATGHPQVLINYARASRGPWRFKALIDASGHAASSRFITLRECSESLFAVWGILNSTVANAFAFCHLSKRDNVVSRVGQTPMPTSGFKAIDETARDYFSKASIDASADELRMALDRVDAAVLDAYSLPLEIEHQILSLFTGWERVGVSFEQTRFLPAELEGVLPYADFVAYESNWKKTNRRRGKLIEKNIEGTISDDEHAELQRLQSYAEFHLEQVAPRPTNALDELEDILLRSGKDAE